MYHKRNKIVRAWCNLPFDRVRISAEGWVNFCCHMGVETLGNILTQPFEDLWFGNQAEDIRDALRNASLHPMCNTRECLVQYVPLEHRMQNHEVRATGYPCQLELDLHGSHCNFGGNRPTPQTACIMCPRARPDFQKHLDAHPDKTDKIIERIKHIVPYLKEINILGLSESFWKGRIFEVLEQLDFPEHREDITVWTTSNGSCLDAQTRQRFGQMVRSSVIDFSIDAATAETFLKIRRQKIFDRVCDNIRAWCEERQNHDGEHKANLHNNINTLNLHEVPDMVVLAKRLGVDFLKLIPTHTFYTHPDVDDLVVNEENAQEFYDAQKAAEKLGDRIGQKVLFSRPLSLDFPVNPEGA